MRKLLISVAVVLAIGAIARLDAQTVVDRTIATISDSSRTELITYSDLLWQLALQPNTPIDPPSATDLNRALQIQIDQRIFALEAERLPRAAPTETEISDRITQILSFYPSSAEFEKRLGSVGFKSIKDDNFERIIAQRVAIEKYIDFRFRSFVVVTTEDEAAYYRDIWVSQFRRNKPNAIVPPRDAPGVPPELPASTISGFEAASADGCTMGQASEAHQAGDFDCE